MEGGREGGREGGMECLGWSMIESRKKEDKSETTIQPGA